MSETEYRLEKARLEEAIRNTEKHFPRVSERYRRRLRELEKDYMDAMHDTNRQ